MDNFILKTSDEEIKSKKEYILAVQHTNNFSIILKSKFSLEIYNNEMKLQENIALELPHKDLRFQDIFIVNGEIYLFMNRYNGKNNEHYLYATILSKKRGVVNDIYQIEKIKMGDQLKKHQQEKEKFEVSVTADSLAFLVRSSTKLMDYDKNAKRKFSFISLDFELLDERTVVFPELEKHFFLSKTITDKKGNIFLASHRSFVENDKTIFKPEVFGRNKAFFYSLFFDENHISTHEIQHSTRSSFNISELKTKIDSHGNVRCMAFFSATYEYAAIGSYSFTMNTESREIEDEKTFQFEDGLIDQFYTEEQIHERNEKRKEDIYIWTNQLHNFIMHDLVMKNDGGYYLIAEQIHPLKTSKEDPHFTPRIGIPIKQNYSFNGLMIFSISKNNELIEYSVIPKKQASKNHISYGQHYGVGIVMSLGNNDDLNIFFNDDKEYLDEKFNTSTNDMFIEDQVFIRYTISLDGRISKHPIIETDKHNINIDPITSPKIQGNKLFLISRRNRYYYKPLTLEMMKE